MAKAKLVKWGLRKVQKLLGDCAYDPLTDPAWSITGDGLSNDYYLVEAIKNIKLLSTVEDKKRHFTLAIQALVMWWVKSHPQG